MMISSTSSAALSKHRSSTSSSFFTIFDETGRVTFSYYRERLIKNRAGMSWVGAVHEAITPVGTVLYGDFAEQRLQCCLVMAQLLMTVGAVAAGVDVVLHPSPALLQKPFKDSQRAPVTIAREQASFRKQIFFVTHDIMPLDDKMSS